MNRNNFIKVCALFTAAAMLSGITGCGTAGSAAKISQNGIYVDADGQIRLAVVEAFDQEYYDLSELTGMVVEEVAQYNGQHREAGITPVVMDEVAMVEGSGDLVKVVYRFADGKSYGAFQGETFYYESLDVAVAAKHVFTGEVLFNEKGSITLDESSKAKLKGKHVIVTDVKTRIVVPSEVLYYSEGVKLQKDGSVDTSECDDRVVLVLKK